MKTSPTQRSLAHLRKQGYTAQVVERWIPGANLRKDLFGGIDVVAIGRPPTIAKLIDNDGNWTKAADEMRNGVGCLGVQSTSDANVAARRTKLLALPELRLWVECGNRLVIHGWAKKGARGKRKLWTLREVELTLADFESTATASDTTDEFTAEDGRVIGGDDYRRAIGSRGEGPGKGGNA